MDAPPSDPLGGFSFTTPVSGPLLTRERVALGRQLNAQGWRRLAAEVATNERTTWLDLSSTYLGTDNFIPITESLRRNSHVQTLYLSYNLFDDRGVRSLADALRDNETLTRLALAGNRNITEEGWRTLLEVVLTWNDVLRSIELGPVPSSNGSSSLSALPAALLQTEARTSTVRKRRLGSLALLLLSVQAERASRSKDTEAGCGFARLPLDLLVAVFAQEGLEWERRIKEKQQMQIGKRAERGRLSLRFIPSPARPPPVLPSSSSINPASLTLGASDGFV